MKRRLLKAILATSFLFCPGQYATAAEPLQVMLQGESAAKLSTLVTRAGGRITHNLPVINAVGAQFSPEQLAAVLQSPLVTRHINDLGSEDDNPKKDDVSCRVRGHIELELISPQEIRWPLYNKLPIPTQLQTLKIQWPAALGAVSALSLGAHTIDPALYSEATAGSLEIQFASDEKFLIGERTDLVVRFKSSDADTAYLPLRQRDFTIEATFNTGCATELVPGYENNHENFYYNTVAGVDSLHRQGITGKGVTIAIIDSGLWENDALMNDTSGQNRVLARYDARTDIGDKEVVDESGHGTHMTSIAIHSGPTLRDGQPTGTYKGVAPDASLVAIKVLDEEGLAQLLDIVRAVQWVVDHRAEYNIRVLNLSFSQKPRWPYWEDPVNQAVMQAWADGIVVVAAAGNEGPDVMTIGSPGNLPYIITVGAVTDSWTPDTRDDDYLPDFSSRGPTPDGHIKPDIVALGGHMTGLIHPESAIARRQPEDILRTGEFVSTGSSQASAFVSGMIALLIQLEPDITPDDLKCKLITSAEPAINEDGLLAYSPFQQGYGYVTPARAVMLGETGCGNADLNLLDDIQGKQHFYGPAIIEEDGSPSLPGLRGMVSTAPSAKGHSDTRKWGLKGHIERKNTGRKKIPAAPEATDWPRLYEQEKAAIEALTRSGP